MAKRIPGAKQGTEVSRLLRSLNTHNYLTEKGWTTNPEEAKDFTDVVEAAQICAQQGLMDMELILRMKPQGCDLFCLPLR